jgi:hypothetical protein
VAPGEEVKVHVGLLRYRGERVTRQLTLRVPETAEPGTQISVIVCSAQVNRMIRMGLDPGFFEPRDFEHLLEVLKTPESNKNLILRASVAQQGLRYEGDAMPALPPSALAVLEYGAGGDRAAPLTTDIKQTVETPWVLEGAQTLTLTVKKREPHNL